jgi:molybdate transport system substrate-binding protein
MIPRDSETSTTNLRWARTTEQFVPGMVKTLSAGAAQALVERVAEQFREETGVRVSGRFGPVGAMREALLAGDPCDVVIVSEVMMKSLAESGEVIGATMASLGQVGTGLAVPSGDGLPDISTPESLRMTAVQSAGVYLPDPVRATAGGHFAAVLRQLGVYDICAPRIRTFPSGSAAMKGLAAAEGVRLIGCAQTTEILNRPGVRLAGGLPEPFQLSTTYTAGVSRQARDGGMSARFVELLAGPRSKATRLAAGFEAV